MELQTVINVKNVSALWNFHSFILTSSCKAFQDMNYTAIDTTILDVDGLGIGMTSYHKILVKVNLLPSASSHPALLGKLFVVHFQLTVAAGSRLSRAGITCTCPSRVPLLTVHSSSANLRASKTSYRWMWSTGTGLPPVGILIKM